MRCIRPLKKNKKQVLVPSVVHHNTPVYPFDKGGEFIDHYIAAVSGRGSGKEGVNVAVSSVSNALVPLLLWPGCLLDWSHGTPRLLQTVFAGDCSLCLLLVGVLPILHSPLSLPLDRLNFLLVPKP